jgi:methanethiol S-methyltransferase
MRKLLFLQFALFAIFVAAWGSAAFGLLFWDFLFPGTFKNWYLFQGGMPLNLVLLLIFGIQHSLMARRGFKLALRRYFPEELMRSFYVMCTGFVLFMLALLWSPSGTPIYDLRGTPAGIALTVGAAIGGIIVLLGGAAIDALDLFGIRAFLNILHDRKPKDPPFATPSLYKIVRHPLYLGLLLLFWLTPAMTHDHLFFAEVMTAYILLGIQFEEIDLVHRYGDTYRNYQKEVPMLIPFLKFKRQHKR